MRTIVLEQPGRFVLTDTPAPPAPGPGEVAINIRSVGICGTDLHAYRGKQPFFSYPRILGHELGVEVAAVGDGVSNVAPGDLCAVNPYLNCGQCGPCRRGKTNCCEKLRVLGVHVDGGMREQIIVPATHVYPSQTLTLRQLALVETLGIGAHAVNRAAVQAGERALVIGAGPIGLSVLEFLRLEGADLGLLEISEPRRRFAESCFPGIRCYPAFEQAQAEAEPAVVFDCTGNPASMHAAFKLPVNGSRLVFVGLFVGDVTFHDPDFHRKELTLLASRNGTPAEHRRIVGLLESGRIDTSPWISETAPASEIIERFPRWLDPAAGVVKAVIEF
ncbi:MAG: zinc-binding alcohol dehydrogenase family protein [Acidobacteria bacterium]|nr:zinc-binding alcohol dehydrogenase family protein [Acidobacteriota bacterium]